MKTQSHNQACRADEFLSIKAFSIVELLATIILIGAIAAMGLVAYGKVSEAAQRNKVESDVKTLNSAIKIYQANGGDLTGLTTVEQVLNRLKTSRSRASKDTHVGAPSGRMIDVRIVAVPVEEASWKGRAFFDVPTGKFVVADTGSGGVEFTMDESLNESFFGIETRSDGVVSYAANAKWVWDHASVVNPNGSQVVDRVTTTEPPPDSIPPVEVDDSTLTDVIVDELILTDSNGDATGGNPPLIYLSTPIFSEVSGAHPEAEFPLSVTLTNVPDPSAGLPFYRIGSGAWTPYTGPITVPMEPTYVYAYYQAANSDTHRNSSTRSAYYYPLVDSISGQVRSRFHSPVGGENLVYDLSSDGLTFVHGNNEYDPGNGDPPIPVGEPNSLVAAPNTFTDVVPNTEFVVTSLSYHNGNSFYDSHATGVTLNISMSIADTGQTISFNLTMNLVNTPNDPSDPDASADYVQFTNLSQYIAIQINGVSYRLSLSLRATDSFGFSSGTQFHVYEGNTGVAEIVGRFIP